MDKQQIQSILQEEVENKIPSSEIRLWDAVKAGLVGVHLQPGEKMKATQLRRASRVAFVTLTIIALLALAFVTPRGRAFAQELLAYFTTVSQRFIPPLPTPLPAPTYTLEARLIPQPTIPVNHQNCGEVVSPVSSTFICQLQDAQTSLGFVVKSFPVRYVQAPFDFMWVDQEHRTIQLIFRDQQANYYLAQGLGDFPRDSSGYAIYQEAVQPVRVGAYPAEYARGIFIFPGGRVDQDMVWNPDEPVYHLRWKEDERWYAFTLSTDQFAGLEPAEIQAKMSLLAENLVSLDQGADQLTAGSQLSIKDSAGFTIKEPGLLPEGFQQVPDPSWGRLTTAPRVGMHYEYRVNGRWVNSLSLDQMLIPADDKTLRWEFSVGVNAEANMGEVVQINGVTGYYLDGGEANTSALYWRDDEREYLLMYAWTPNFGGRLDKETLIAIAESLRLAR
jgi:hypothetical protein